MTLSCCCVTQVEK